MKSPFSLMRAVKPDTHNSTGRRAPDPGRRPTGHFSHSEIPAKGGGGPAGDGGRADRVVLHFTRSVAAKVHHTIFAWRAGATSAESTEGHLIGSQWVKGPHQVSDAADTHGAASAGGGDRPHPAAAHLPCGEPRNHAEEIANARAYVARRKRIESLARIEFELEC